MREPPLAAKLGAEFLGTFLLVFGGCGSVIIAGEFLSKNDVQLGIGLLGIGLAFGLAVLVGAFAFGHVSGGHFNPAVSIGLAIAKRFDWKGVLPYIITQIRPLLPALCCWRSRLASRDLAQSRVALRPMVMGIGHPAGMASSPP
jgi:Major intrinsic protein